MIIERQTAQAMAERGLEIVERKGKGHPDSMCDAMLEAISVDLSTYYLERFGTVLHHNIDKGLLAAGEVEMWFGGGRIIKPMELTIGDRATMRVGDMEIPVGEIAVGAAKKWVENNMRFVHPETDLTFRSALSGGSAELTEIFTRSGDLRGANDTSAAVGFYPLTPTETLVRNLESHLNSDRFKKEFPESGEDVKVMAVRNRDRLDLTVAMPLMARFVGSEEEYFARKETIRGAIRDFCERHAVFDEIAVHYNCLDQPGHGLGGIYLSLLGTSAEDADSGQVGRGNRVNGLISVMRPLGTEAAAGKNPVSHVGKIYNVLAHRMARQIYERIDGLREVTVFLVSRIGAPIDRPQQAAARLLLGPGQKITDVRPQAEEIIAENLTAIGELCKELIVGKHTIC